MVRIVAYLPFAIGLASIGGGGGGAAATAGRGLRGADGARVVRGRAVVARLARAAFLDGLDGLARPERPKRWTLPMTALRVNPLLWNQKRAESPFEKLFTYVPFSGTIYCVWR